ncbi:MAG: acyltransferase [Burkholderiales bacterium]|jgi:predicted LPLAT superfamily acyltransferase|nr:acyltransferase [Burkholderiales bacterium]
MDKRETKTRAHWAQMQEAGGLTGMRFLLFVYRVCGRWPFRFLLFFVLLWFYARRRAAREASRDYLQRLCAFSSGTTPAPSSRNVFRHFTAFSEILLDKLLVVGSAATTGNFCVDGVEHIEALYQQKRGALFVTAHIGNIELCRKLGERYAGLRLTILGHTKNAARFVRLMKERDPKYEFDMVQVADIGVDTAIALAQRVSAGGIIVITGDRVPTDSMAATVRVPFLGEDASFPISPYILAATLQCPLFAVFGTRRNENGGGASGNRFVITLRQLAETISLPRRVRSGRKNDKESDREKTIVPYAAAFAEALEAECLKAPFQWSNFYSFWALPEFVDSALKTEEAP